MSGGANSLFGGLTASNIYELTLVNDYLMRDVKQGEIDLKLAHPAFKDRDGFILYYSPTCPHCIRFKPTMLELAKRLKGSLAIGTVNCNDAVHGNSLLSDFFNISKLPTMKFYNSVNGEYIDYTGGRTIEDMLTFLCKVKNLCNL